MFFQDVAPRLVGDGRAAQLAAAWPFGLLCSVYIAGGVFATLSPRAQVMLSVVLNAVSVAALGGRQSGGDERLALFRKLIGKVKRGSVTVTEFANAALSPALFGADGRGEAANGNIVGEDPALTALVATLPDEIAEFREELLEALRGRMSSGSSSSTTTHVTRDPV